MQIVASSASLGRAFRASNTELGDESDPVEITVVPIQDYSSSSRSQNVSPQTNQNASPQANQNANQSEKN